MSKTLAATNGRYGDWNATTHTVRTALSYPWNISEAFVAKGAPKSSPDLQVLQLRLSNIHVIAGLLMFLFHGALHWFACELDSCKQPLRFGLNCLAGVR